MAFGSTYYASAVYANSAFGVGSYGFGFDDRYCTGGEDDLNSCCIISSHNCGTSEHAGAYCSSPSIQLHGGSGYDGSVFVFNSNTNAWGYVCDDGWTLNEGSAQRPGGRGRVGVAGAPRRASFERSVGNVVCQQLFGSAYFAQSVYTSAYSLSGYDFVYDDLVCTGNEKGLEACTYSTTHNCGLNAEEAGVICGIPTPNPTPNPTPLPTPIPTPQPTPLPTPLPTPQPPS